MKRYLQLKSYLKVNFLEILIPIINLLIGPTFQLTHICLTSDPAAPQLVMNSGAKKETAKFSGSTHNQIRFLFSDPFYAGNHSLGFRHLR